jgi:glycosyltransferase involved in cell wall biosynthesis
MPASPEQKPSSAQRQPLISVGLPVRDAEETLTVAIASLLDQTCDDWELLILDDYSEDSSRKIALAAATADARVRVLDPAGPRGLVPRLNQAVSAASGEYFARMDADDLAYATRLERQVDFLLSNRSIDLVGTSMTVFGSDGAVKGVRLAPPTHELVCARPRAGFKVFHPTWMARTDWFRTYGYRAIAQGWEDQELLLRAFRRSQLSNLREPLLGYRQDSIRVRRAIVARAKFAKAVLRDEAAHRRYGQAVAVVAEQAAKSLAELTAVTLRMEAVLRNRATPASPTLVAEWERLWARTQSRAERLSNDLRVGGSDMPQRLRFRPL